ncbi:MAG: RsmD family RNA methyltransferase, partial [Arthrobacter sp.]
MSRIIAGVAGGSTLSSVPGSGTRPTTDRTREALFSWLASRGWLDGTAVADLFAGSGALGGEAASRGAAR